MYREKKNYKLIQNISYVYKELISKTGNKHFIMSVFFIILSVSVPLLFTVLPSMVIGGITRGVVVQDIFLYLFGYILFLSLMNYLMQLLDGISKEEVLAFRLSLMKDFGAKIIGIPYEYLESSKGKENIEKASMAVYAGTDRGIEGLINPTIQFVINILGFIVYALISTTLNPWILLVLIISPVVKMYLGKKNRIWKEKAKEKWTPIDVKIDYLDRSGLELKNGKDIRMYKIENWFSDLYNELLGKRFKFFKKEYSRAWLVQLIDRVINGLRDAICYGYLIYQVFNGMDIAMFTLYLGIISGFSQWLFKIVDNYNYLQENNITINDYRYVMEEENYFELGGDKEIPKNNTYTITLEDVTYTYPGSDKPVFENFSLTIKKGEKLAIVGMNGSGKTTLIKLICGLYQPQKGRVLMDGIDVKEFNLREYYNLYSVVFQDVFAFAFPIIDNITCGVEKDNKEELVEKYIKISGLKDKISSLPKGINTNMLKDLEEDGVNFSGGEMQKLMLARALYKDGKILILDEPTAALDPIAEAEMYNKYNDFTKDKTSIFISHRLSSTQFCSHVIFLKDGKIVEEGTHDELLNMKGEYANMYQLQAHYYQEEVEKDVC